KRQATCPVLFLEKRADCAIRRRNRRQVCRRSYRFGRGSRDDLKIVPTRARQATVGDGCRARSQGTTSGRSAERRETVAVPGQGGVLTVAIREERFADRPRDGKRRIVPRNPDLAVGVVEVRALVLDLGNGADHAEAVREALRDVALAEVDGAQR